MPAFEVSRKSHAPSQKHNLGEEEIEGRVHFTLAGVYHEPHNVFTRVKMFPNSTFFHTK